MKPEDTLDVTTQEEASTEVKTQKLNKGRSSKPKTMESTEEEAQTEITIQAEEGATESETTQESATEETTKIAFIEIYTDGACSGNPGPGGYGGIILNNGEVLQVSGGEKLTTNNKMELMGAIYSLKSVQNLDAKVKVYTDSTYVQKGITEWIENWKKKNFKDVKNVELWKELDELSSKLNIEWHWIKAHAGHKYNEMADALARSEVSKNR